MADGILTLRRSIISVINTGVIYTLSAQHTKLLNTSRSFKTGIHCKQYLFFTWTHSSDTKARPGTTFSANVRAGSTQYNTYVPDNAFRNYDNNLSSSIAYNKIWNQGKYNLSVSLNETQNSVTRLINLNLPTIAFSAHRPFILSKKKNRLAHLNGIRSLGIGYTGNLLNVISFYDSAFNCKRVLDTIQWGVDHRIPITLSLPPIGPLIVSPSIGYEERWFAQKIIYTWNDSE